MSDTAFIETPIGAFGNDYLTKNVSELKYSRDSLLAQLLVSKQKFVNGLNSDRYFKYENKCSEKQEVKNIPENEEVNIDSLFEKSNKSEQLVILNSALNIAERNKRYVSINSDIIKSTRKNVFMHEISWHEKFTFPFACLIFFFVGAPLGAIIRKGGFGLPFLVSVVFFLIYYIVSILGKKFVEEGLLPAWQGMWLSSLLTLPLGLLFTYKATTDSALFDLSTYSKLILEPFKIFKNRLNILKKYWHT
ncbi:MAG: LptF/LptG family permease [Chloroflexia bacterium]|nr:LptF/LptG family permease [Chloroflexia bacterium]